MRGFGRIQKAGLGPNEIVNRTQNERACLNKVVVLTAALLQAQM